MLHAKDTTSPYHATHWIDRRHWSRFTPDSPQDEDGPMGMIATLIVLGLIVTACILALAVA